MLHWKKRIAEWNDILGMVEGTVPWWKMTRAILTGPVPAATWRMRQRKCGTCPVYGRRLLPKNGVFTWVGMHICARQIDANTRAGCGCSTVFKALTANPYGDGCWAHSLTSREGWPQYYWHSRWEKWRAIWRFLFPPKSHD